MKALLLAVSLGFLSNGCKKYSSLPTLLPLPTANGPVVSLSIDQSTSGASIAKNFVGLSYETGSLTTNPSFLKPENKILIQLIKNLGQGILRIGGNTSDRTFWTGGGRTPSTGSDSITTTDVATFAAFAKATGWPVLFGLNMGHYNSAAAASEASYVSDQLGTLLLAFQNGNEPNLYSGTGLRPVSYSYADYQNEWENYFSAIRAAIPRAQFAGPDVAYNEWTTAFAKNEQQRILLLDGHYYDAGPASDSAISFHNILAPQSGINTYFSAFSSADSLVKLPYRVSECNSVFGGGKPGVSDVFASGLWGLDFMWLVAEHNGQGINFHGGPQSAYTPISRLNGVVTAMPLYYAMLAFKYGSAEGRIVKANLEATGYNCTAYACIAGNATNVTIINKDAVNLSFEVQLNRTVSSANVYRLTAPSVTSVTGVMFAGRSVNTDGTFVANAIEQYSIGNNVFLVNVPAYSAAVIVAK